MSSSAISMATSDMALDSSSSSSTHSDDALKLFASAPWWLYCTSWKLAKLENVGTESCMWKVTGPVDSDTMMQLYRTKRHKGSVLMAGITQAAKDIMRPGQDLPPNAYRTLAHLFEMSRNGVPYTPLDCEGVKSGMSAASWARPLWTICEPSLPVGPAPSCGEQEQEEDETGREQGQNSIPTDEGGGTLQECAEGSDAEGGEQGTDAQSDARRCTDSEEDMQLAVKLLKSAPAWCYLYSHEIGKSKKTPPKSAAHMVDMYKSGCLPEWTPLLGLRQEVAHFNSLPPSLFTTLGALLTVLQAGLELQPVGLVELQRYDKFIERRNNVGSTMRVPSSDNLHGGNVLMKGRTAPAPAGPVDGLSRAMSGLAPVLSKAAPTNGSSHYTAGSCNSSTTGGAPAISPNCHGTWAPPGGIVVNGDSPCSPLQIPTATYPESLTSPGMVSPYSMAMQPQMQMYQMMPTWLWGMQHMPYTLMASPQGSPAAPHGVVASSQTCVAPSPTARRSGQSKRSSAGSRVGISVPPSPGGPGAAPEPSPTVPTMAAMAAVSSPGTAPHRLTQNSNHVAMGHLSTGGARHGSSMLLASPMSSGPSGAGGPMLMAASPHGAPSPHHVLMPADAAAAMQQAGLWGCWPTPTPMPAAVAPLPSGTSWSTSVFRLFMADCSRGMDVPVWWYLDHRAPNGLVGPLNCEAMIMAYASGTLTEQNIVCGTHSDVTAACPPAKEFFEELGGLLRQVEAGGQYVLVTLAEVTQHASLASSGGGSSSLGGAPGSRQGGSSGKGSARKSKGSAGSASSGINSTSSAPVPPRTPTSQTSPRQHIAGSLSADAPDRWDPNATRCSPTAKGTKMATIRSPGAPQRTTQVSPGAPTARRMLTAELAHDGTPSEGGSLYQQQQRDTIACGALARAAAAAALGNSLGPGAAPAANGHAACNGTDQSDSAFSSNEAVAAAAAAVVSAASVGGARGDSRTGSVGGVAPRSESGRLISCLGVRDQARKSSRGGNGPLSAKASLEEDQTHVLNDLISLATVPGSATGTGGQEGQLRDSDDDVRGPAARDAHDSCNYSSGGAIQHPGEQYRQAVVQGTESVVAVATAVAPV